MNRLNIGSLVLVNGKLRGGLAKNYKRTDKIVLDGEEVTVGYVMDLLDECSAKAQDADAKRRVYQQAVADYHAIATEARKLGSALRARLICDLGKTSPALGDYGIAPRKTAAPLTVEERSAAVAKAKRTRGARHTMGSKQRLHVTANDVAPEPSPVTAPPNGVTVNGASVSANGASASGTNGASH
jgi:hypothetical protein